MLGRKGEEEESWSHHHQDENVMMDRKGCQEMAQIQETKVRKSTSMQQIPAMMNQSKLVTLSLKITPQLHKIQAQLPTNRLLATSPRRNGLPTTEEMMAAWNLVVQQQQEQEHAQHNDNNNGDNNRISTAEKRALSYRVAKQLQKKACQHSHTRLGENSYLQEM